MKDKNDKIKPKGKKLLLTVLILCIAALAVYGVRWLKLSVAGPASSIPARAKGDPNASIKIVEFMDFQCPACAQGALFLGDYLEKNPGKIYLEVKYFPLERNHIHAVRAARYAECASRQGKFWKVHDLLMKRQAEWRDLLNAEPLFENIVQTAQLDPQKLDVCLAEDSVSDLIIREKKEGQARGIVSTPTYFVNGKMVVGPAGLKKELGVQ